MSRPGRAVTAGPLHGVGVVVRAGAVVAVKQEGSEVEIQADCDLHDPEEDHLHAAATRIGGGAEVGSSVLGVFRLVGGTGKFANASGACAYAVHYMEEDDDLVFVARCDG